MKQKIKNKLTRNYVILYVNIILNIWLCILMVKYFIINQTYYNFPELYKTYIVTNSYLILYALLNLFGIIYPSRQRMINILKKNEDHILIKYKSITIIKMIYDIIIFIISIIVIIISYFSGQIFYEFDFFNINNDDYVYLLNEKQTSYIIFFTYSMLISIRLYLKNRGTKYYKRCFGQ